MTFSKTDKVETYSKSDVVTPLVSIVKTDGNRLYTIERSQLEDLIYLVNS